MISSDERLDRVKTIDTARGDLELGVTDALARHFERHPVQRKKISQRRLNFERRRPRFLRECIAEATGTCLYTYCGIAATTTLLLAASDPATAPIASAYSSFLQIGLAYGVGIAFAIIICAPTSGGHFNPAVTISLALWQGFPLRKVPHFILSQISGSFIAGMLLMGQYHEQLSAFAAQSIAEGRGTVYNVGPAAALVTIPGPTQTNLGYLFMNEWFVCTFIGLVIWACLDPANPFVSPQTAPWAIGLGYTVMIWGFAYDSIATNLARDLGCRLVALIFYGSEVFTYHKYSWIAILMNVPATLFATGIYELVMRDSLQKISKRAALHEGGEEALQRHLTEEGLWTEIGAMNQVSKDGSSVFKIEDVSV